MSDQARIPMQQSETDGHDDCLISTVERSMGKQERNRRIVLTTEKILGEEQP